MGKQYKRSFKVYSAWNYQREIEDLNRASEQGWQLVRGGCFHSVFEKNPNVQYRYQLDYNNDIKDMERYDETFRDAGWERVNSTFNGWHVFRKAYEVAKAAGLEIVASKCAEILTVQEAAGFQMFVGVFDDETLAMYNEPCDTPYWVVR